MKQTELAWSHSRYWGCRVCCSIETAERLTGITLSAVQYDDLIHIGIDLGYVLDNDVPVSQKNDWYRCFLVDPINFLKLCLRICGRIAKTVEELKSEDGATSIVRRWKTDIGSHYTENDYDPWPELKRGVLLGERYWKIELYPKDWVET